MKRSLVSNIIILIVFVAGGIIVLKKCNAGSSFKDLFTSKPVEIDETPILIKEIKEIGRLITAVSSDEVVVEATLPTRGSGFVNSVNRFSPFKILPSADKRIVLIGKGKVLAGTNMSQLRDNLVKTSKDTVQVTIPRATIIDAIMNPSDFETFEEKGKWTQDEITRVKLNARQKMINRALQNKLLQTADRKAKKIIAQFLFAAGFKVVIVSVG